MDQSTYFAVALLFAVFLVTVLLSNVAAIAVTFVINRFIKRKVKRL